MKLEKLELGKGRKTLLNRCLIFGTEEDFIKRIGYLKKYNFDISHYENTYRKIQEGR